MFAMAVAQIFSEGPSMSRITVREIVLVLALVVVSTNWVLDHRAQTAKQEVWQREMETAKGVHQKAS